MKVFCSSAAQALSHALPKDVLGLKVSPQFMRAEELSQSAEVNADTGNIDPRFNTGLCGLVIAYQATLVHQPAEGSLHDPAVGQSFRRCIRGPPRGGKARRTSPKRAQEDLYARAFGGAGSGDRHAEHEAPRCPPTDAVYDF